MTLLLADDLTLPDDAITQTFGIIGKRGSGKTYATSVFAEEVIAAKLPITIVDPLGVWWGLRAGVDGNTDDGLPVVIFGGRRGDIPLEPTAGAVIADFLIEDPAPSILDLSAMPSKAAQRRFMTDLTVRLYQGNELPLLVVLDEADLWAPQRSGPDAYTLLGAMEDLVRRGRGHGLGCVLPTQRPAVINKDVLTQIDTLITFRLTGPQDQDAVADWVKRHADRDTAQRMLSDLPSLPVGDAWLWSPGWLEEFRRVRFRERRTFDSSATPKVGQADARRAVSLATLDLDALTARMAATIDRALADDPATLRKRIKDLEARLAAAQADTDRRVAEALADVEPERIHVLDESLIARLDRARQVIETEADTIRTVLDEALDAMPDERPEPERDTNGYALPTTAPPPAAPADVAVVLPPAPNGTDPERMPKADRAILTALAQFPKGLDKNQLSILTGYSASSGSFAQALARLRAAGWIFDGWPAIVRHEGLQALGPFDPLPTGQPLLDYWLDRLSLAESRVLRVFVDLYPGVADRAQLATVTGYSPTSGSFAQAIAKLRALSLVEGWRVSDDFMAAIR